MKRALIKPADAIVIAAVLAVAVISVICFLGTNAEQLIISKNGSQIASMPLNKNGSYALSELTVTVKDGVAFIESSSCKDKICMRSRLKKSGDCAVCLPNKISVAVSGQADADAVTY